MRFSSLRATQLMQHVFGKASCPNGLNKLTFLRIFFLLGFMFGVVCSDYNFNIMEQKNLLLAMNFLC